MSVLKRKWGKEIQHDKDLFEDCVATILRQVDHIRETAHSFSGFAKTPAPQKKKMNLVDAIRDVIFLEQMRVYYIEHLFEYDTSDIYILGDDRLLSQAMINILKNAAESIALASPDKGKIIISVHIEKMMAHIIIKDNGTGLPADIPSYKFFEPYVTEREEGTGLGLAITSKIVKDHGGRIAINSRDDGHGAEVSIILPLLNISSDAESDKLEIEEAI